MKRNILADGFARFLAWLRPKAMPSVLTGSQWSGTSFVDAYRRNRNPTPNELLAELKGTAWTCASLNAAVCASFPPRLFVTTRKGEARPKCLTKAVSRKCLQRLRSDPHLEVRTRAADSVEEVTQHPLLDLLAQVNPTHNAFNLWTNTRVAFSSPARNRQYHRSTLSDGFWYSTRLPRSCCPLIGRGVYEEDQSRSTR